MRRRIGGIAAVVAAAAALCVPAASAAPRMLLGMLDDANVLGDPAATFPVLSELHVQVVRMTLNWRAVAPTQPTDPRNPDDPAYNWTRVDRAVQAADDAGIKVLLTIWGTPAWANGGQTAPHAPTSPKTLSDFAYAAATHYSTVKLWLAWNEPNNPIDLAPQYTRSGSKWVLASPAAYAKICAAVYTGVHAASTGTKVGCGATAPRGNDAPGSSRPSVDPITFLRNVKIAGLRSFDAWAHHPYAGSRFDTPTTRPPAYQHAVELGNLDQLTKELTRLYGPKRIWITEFGFQTNPPDTFFGVSWAKQAAYISQSYAIARKNPRIDIFTWFLLKDDVPVGGWQSGLMTSDGRKKPAFAAFGRLVN
jgi:Glycosyl hydrolase catalytic core